MSNPLHESKIYFENRTATFAIKLHNEELIDEDRAGLHISLEFVCKANLPAFVD